MVDKKPRALFDFVGYLLVSKQARPARGELEGEGQALHEAAYPADLTALRLETKTGALAARAMDKELHGVESLDVTLVKRRVRQAPNVTKPFAVEVEALAGRHEQIGSGSARQEVDQELRTRNQVLEIIQDQKE